MFDSFYSMHASLCFEKLYNFWDRIGDKIANEFSSKFPNPKRVMFANVIDKLKEDFETDENFMWLIAFRNDGFKDFNDKRKLVVHYEQIETKYQTAILDNIGDMQKIEEIFLEKSTLPEFFKRHIDLSNKGILKTYDFVKSIA